MDDDGRGGDVQPCACGARVEHKTGRTVERRELIYDGLAICLRCAAIDGTPPGGGQFRSGLLQQVADPVVGRENDHLAPIDECLMKQRNCPLHLRRHERCCIACHHVGTFVVFCLVPAPQPRVRAEQLQLQRCNQRPGHRIFLEGRLPDQFVLPGEVVVEQNGQVDVDPLGQVARHIGNPPLQGNRVGQPCKTLSGFYSVGIVDLENALLAQHSGHRQIDQRP